MDLLADRRSFWHALFLVQFEEVTLIDLLALFRPRQVNFFPKYMFGTELCFSDWCCLILLDLAPDFLAEMGVLFCELFGARQVNNVVEADGQTFLKHIDED